MLGSPSENGQRRLCHPSRAWSTSGQPRLPQYPAILALGDVPVRRHQARRPAPLAGSETPASDILTTMGKGLSPKATGPPTAIPPTYWEGQPGSLSRQGK